MFARLPGQDLFNRRWIGLCLALAALGLALALRLLPGAGERVWLIPLVGLALVPAALPGPGLVLVAVGLANLAAWLILPGTAAVESMITGLLLVAVALLLAAIAGEVRAAPTSRLTARLERRWRANVIGEMTAILSHELTQPMTAAATYLHAGQTQLERTGGVDPGATLDRARSQLLRAGQTLSEMRRRLIPKAGERRPERVSDLVRALTPIVTEMGAAAGVAVAVRIDPHGDQVLADGIQIQQAMLNLVRNAIESVAGRGGRVIIRGRSISTDQYEIAIEDTGPGITPEAWSLTLHPSMDNALDGRGLGLSVTRTILKNHSSHLAVRPVGSGGAGVHFSLARVAESGVRT